ncbi:MAG: PKD domain-containing protein, partial [Pedobacter sp.]
MTGATYTASIPGTASYPSRAGDNSPSFSQSISVVCFRKPFNLDFSAVDTDNDSLVYRLCAAYNSPGQRNSTEETFPPPYPFASYTGSFSGGFPLGSDVSINSSTGIISGIAPDAGKYVVSVCVESYDRSTRRYISTHRKDFIVNVAPCDVAGVQLAPSYLSCDGFTFNFSNLNTSPLNETFLWDFGDGTTSSDPSPTHTYTVAGDYTIKLVVNGGDECADSAFAPLKVYPGFFPGFTDNTPTCKGVPVQFNDITTATYGAVNSWRWDFGVLSLLNDTSRVRNPTFVYDTPGEYDLTFIVGSDKGCGDTVLKKIIVLDKAPYTVSNDTLICSIDTLQLNFATPNPGTVVWTPNYMISNVNSYNPLVSPDVTTTYYVSYADNFGCTAVDSVLVRVVDRVTVSAMNDTTICRTDSVNLSINSDGLQYSWTPAATLNDPTLQDPVAFPTAASTTYSVIASIGKCFTQEDIIVRTVPYPLANAGPDSTICFGNSIQLNASGGSIYSWTPRLFLNNSNIPNPVSQSPQQSIDYVVTVRDVLGCPKPVSDTM